MLLFVKEFIQHGQATGKHYTYCICEGHVSMGPPACQQAYSQNLMSV